MLTDERIIRELNNGSHEGFRAVYDAHKFRILSIIVKLVNSESVAEEIFQRVFIKLWDNRTNINPDGSLAAYLNTIARNEVYSYWRTAINKNSLRLSLDHGLPDGGLADQEIENEDFRNYLFSLADGLPAKCRQVFDMRFMQQMSYREIAGELGISERTVENQVAKSLKHIREKLGRSGDLLVSLLVSGLFC